MNIPDSKKLPIDETLVRELIQQQFPSWSHLPIKPVAEGGWDNKTFHLGDEMLIRLPSAKCYAAQVEKEQKWLPKLAPFLSLEIPTPLALGKPSKSYPMHWSVYQWIKGIPASITEIPDLQVFAIDLATFLVAFQKIDTTGGPAGGEHNFYRGCSLKTYDHEVQAALKILQNRIDTNRVSAIWNQALSTEWTQNPVWVHGDIAPGNLLLRNGRLAAVIDFGCLGVGDPACDLVMAWTLFGNESRQAFKETLGLDAATWDRARGWALWKALFICAQLPGSNPKEIERSWKVIDEVMREVADH